MEKVVIVGLRPRQLTEVVNKKITHNGERIEIAGVVPEEATPGVVARACKGANRVIVMTGHVPTPAADAVPAALRTNISGAASAVVRQLTKWYGEPHTVMAAKKSASKNVTKVVAPTKSVTGPAPRLKRTDFQLGAIMPELVGLKLKTEIPEGHDSKYDPKDFEALAPIVPHGDLVPATVHCSAPKMRLLKPATTPAPVWVERVSKYLHHLHLATGRVYEVHYFADYTDILWVDTIDWAEQAAFSESMQTAPEPATEVVDTDHADKLANYKSDDDVERELWADVYVTTYQDTRSAAAALKEADEALAQFRKRFS